MTSVLAAGSARLKTGGLLALGVIMVLNLSACSAVKKFRGSTPVQRIEGENQALDYPDDPKRATYTVNRFGHRQKASSRAVAKAQVPEKSEIEHNTPVAAISPPPARRASLGRRPSAGQVAAAPPAPYRRSNLLSCPPAPGIPEVPSEDIVDQPADPVVQTDLVKEASVAPPAPSPWVRDVARPWNLGVLLASFKSRDAALAGWEGLIDEHAELGPYFPFIQRVDLGAEKGGIFFRLIAAPVESREDADRLCDRLEAAGQFCCIAFAGGEVEW